MAAAQPNVVGGELLSQGGTGQEGGRQSEVDKWLGSSRVPASQQPSPPAAPVDPASSDPEVRAARQWRSASTLIQQAATIGRRPLVE
ncbi:hypothetical protein TRIUR3_23882 [Triticum urartu]|uniref:Uncharacterized protein n=1 Tax=Triticum urartu TaxID=4572 RepID=M7YL01_TRIUA|nr:hypothetical protein TRIUR3_23882 [Triticum urartu]